MAAGRSPAPKGRASDDAALRSLIRAIAVRDEPAASRALAANPGLALATVVKGATRQASTGFYLTEIGHYVYGGDTALHIAAAAYARGIAKQLLANGADVRARNRRGAEPLHYACDGAPGSPAWDPAAQAALVELLIKAGANPNARDKSGVAPLHRAVRTRCSAAVRALLANGADARLANGNGSTPLDLAVRTTGRGGSGTTQARDEQQKIIRLLRDS